MPFKLFSRGAAKNLGSSKRYFTLLLYDFACIILISLFINLAGKIISESLNQFNIAERI